VGKPIEQFLPPRAFERPWRADGRLGLPRGVVVLLFWLAGGGLLIWVSMLLGSVAPSESTIYHVTLIRIGYTVLLGGSMLGTAYLVPRNDAHAVVAASFMVTLALATGWFSDLGIAAQPSIGLLFLAGIVRIPIVLIGSLIVLRIFHVEGRVRAAVGERTGTIVAGLVAGLLIVSLISITHTPTIQHDQHYLLSWTWLDLFELLGLAASGLLALRHSRWLAVSATFTAALLVSDAWFDVVSTSASKITQSALLALIEIPGAVFCLVVAWHEVSGWDHEILAKGGTPRRLHHQIHQSQVDGSESGESS